MLLVWLRRACVRFSQHALHDCHEVFQAPQISIFTIAFHPGQPVGQGLFVRQWHRLAKVNHPDSGKPRFVMHKKEGAAYHLETEKTQQGP